MVANKICNDIGSHNSTIIALHINRISESDMEIVTLDEDGFIQIHRSNTALVQIQLSKYPIFDHPRLEYQGSLLDPVELFGMGYPYYIKKANNIIILSSDEGVLVLRLTP